MTSTLTNQEIIDKYYEISSDNLSEPMLRMLNKIIDDRRPEFNKYHCTLETLYEKSGKFPFFLKPDEIKTIIEKDQLFIRDIERM